jgi:hypothetical protein
MGGIYEYVVEMGSGIQKLVRGIHRHTDIMVFHSTLHEAEVG